MYEPLFPIVISELDRIRNSGCKERVNLSRLADKVGISKQALSGVLHGYYQGSPDIPVRIACVLGSDSQTATEIIHAAGYDISKDWSPRNKHYRAALAADDLDQINAELDGAGTYICGRF